MATQAQTDPGRSVPDPVDVHVGARVRLRRKELSLSQDKLADALGLTFQQIQKYERGQNRVSASKLWQASQYLAVPIEWFFEGLEGASGDLAPGGLSADAASLATDDYGPVLVRAWPRMSGLHKRLTAQIATQLAQSEDVSRHFQAVSAELGTGASA